jgi:hypothetical protein
MKTVKIEPLAVTVELSITECLVLAIAGHDADGLESTPDSTLLEALAGGLMGTAFGAYVLAKGDAPLNLRHMWEMWAPHDHRGWVCQQLHPPDWFVPHEPTP